jgi:glycosyltransferase involved in cell wall biosynthesis
MREKISACVICFNEEAKIRRCLESLAWCDEIVVVDSFSQDRTVAICREFTDLIYQHEWQGYIGQRNLIRQMAHHPWVLFLDADEEISPALRDEIVQTFERGTGEVAGFEFPRQVCYLGRWIRHGAWYPDIKLRLFRKDSGVSAGMEPHDHVEVNGPVRRLRHPIWHYTYNSIYDHLETINRFSSIAANEKFRSGGRFRLLDLLFRPFWRFVRGYVFRAGWREGIRGLIIALLGSMEVAIKYAKLWELELTRSGRGAKLPGKPPGSGGETA